MTTPAMQEQHQSADEARKAAQAIWEELEKEDEQGAAGDNPPEQPAGEASPAPESVAPQPEQKPTAAPSSLSDEERALLRQIPEVMQLVKSTVGRVGSLQSELSKLGKQAAATQGAGEQKPTNAQIEKASVSPEKWEALKSDFPDWAEGVEQFVRANIPVREQAPDVEAVVKQRLEEQAASMTKLRQEDAMEMVSVVDPNWRSKAATQEFKTWLSAQPPEYQQRALNTWKPSEILKTVRDFDAHAEATKKQRESSTSRLQAAAIPRSTGKTKIVKPVEEMSDKEYWAFLDEQDAAEQRRAGR